MEPKIRRDQLEKIRHFLELEYYDSVVKESVSLLEEVLKKTYKSALSEFSIADRTYLMEAESSIGNNKGYNKFGFGELVGLFRKSKLLSKWEANTNQNLGIIKSISLDYIADLRNNLTHNSTSENKCTQNEAVLVFDCLKNWLSFIGYSELDSGLQKSMENSSDKSHENTEEGLNNKEDIKNVHLHSVVDSSYSSSTRKEQRRLAVQYEYSKICDENSFLRGIKQLGKVENMFGLDIGCADGVITKKRFKSEYGFKKIIGIDFNKESIEKAQVYIDEVFSYHQFNVEDSNFIDDLKDLMDEKGIDNFHSIYIGYTIHHLKNPVRFLRKIRKLLAPGGFIILTGVDDGAQLSYGDDGIIDHIVDLTIKTERISDRFHARKFYSYLINTGYQDISMNYSYQDTVGLSPEAKEFLYQYYFSFRYDYAKKQFDSDPNNESFKAHLNDIVQSLTKLEDLFQKPDFYYLLTTISAIGFK